MNCSECNKDLSYRVTSGGEAVGDSSDKTRMLLERLKGLEVEKSQLVLENEKQRHNYDKCIDEIAKEVVQALLSQKVRAHLLPRHTCAVQSRWRRCVCVCVL